MSRTFPGKAGGGFTFSLSGGDSWCFDTMNPTLIKPCQNGFTMATSLKWTLLDGAADKCFASVYLGQMALLNFFAVNVTNQDSGKPKTGSTAIICQAIRLPMGLYS